MRATETVKGLRSLVLFSLEELEGWSHCTWSFLEVGQGGEDAVVTSNRT